jgi:hypothetical protein
MRSLAAGYHIRNTPGLEGRQDWIGLSSKGCPGGREARSIAFFNAPEVEKLYSGAETSRPSAASILYRNDTTGGE